MGYDVVLPTTEPSYVNTELNCYIVVVVLWGEVRSHTNPGS